MRGNHGEISARILREKECRFNLFCLRDIDGKHDDDEECRETVVEDDFFSDIVPPAYKEGAFCLLSSSPPVAGNS